jgi:hypothetical protein
MEKIKLDKSQKCKCGKFMPLVPYACEKCGMSSIKGKKIRIVALGNFKLPSGKIVL